MVLVTDGIRAYHELSAYVTVRFYTLAAQEHACQPFGRAQGPRDIP